MKKIIVFFTLFIAMLCTLSSRAQNWNQIAKALPTQYSQGFYTQEFGYEVAIDGNYAVVGTYYYESNTGIAFVLYYNGSFWAHQAILYASDGQTGDEFGRTVSISGDNIVIGAWKGNNGNTASGAAYLFTKPTGGWVTMPETAKLLASDGAGGDYFGVSVGISGDNVVVGAHFDDDNGSNSGSAYVFTKPLTGWANMTQTAKIKPSVGAVDDHFGSVVSISGDNIVVGVADNDDNGTNAGCAYVFTKPTGGWTNMTQTAKLLPSDGVTYDNFGNSVSISGDNLVIGAYNDDTWGSAYVFTKPTGGWVNMTQTAKLTASIANGSDNEFGLDVSISGDIIVVGAPFYHFFNGTDNGKVYVYTKPVGGWVNMTQTALLSHWVYSDNQWFGHSVGISGDNIIVGLPTDGSFMGTVDAFTKPVTGWVDATQTQNIQPSAYVGNFQDNFGYSVATDSDYAVVGAPRYNNNFGEAYVFWYDGSAWNKIARLMASDSAANDYFGKSVSISGNNIVVGAYYHDGINSNSGAAYVFTKPGSGWANMTQTAKITASDALGDDYFGYSVSISGDNIVVGAYGRDDNGSSSGCAYVFTKPGLGWANMTQTAKIVPSDGAANDEFGNSVNISGDNIVVGSHLDDDNGSASGSAYVFTKPGSGWADMTQTAKIKPADGASSDQFGISVSISGNNIVVGAEGDDDYGISSGSAYVFTKPGTGWVNMTQTAKILPSDGAAYDYFGFSVGISGDNIVVGSYYDDDNGSASGSAYVYTKPVTGWTDMTQTEKIKPSDGTAYDNFGISVSISGDNIVAGSYHDNDNGSNAGSAYLFINSTTVNTSDHASNSFAFYPNPANKRITVELPGVNWAAIASIYDMQGQLLVQQFMQQAKNEINISGFAKGMYMIRLTAPEGISVKKFIKE